MIEKVKESIDKNKSDRTTHKEYIKSFCNSEKANELLKNDDNFKKLKKTVTNNKEEF